MIRSRFAGLLAMALVVAMVAPVGATTVGASTYNHGDSACTAPVTLTDASGTDVTITQTPERVVVLGGSAAQTTWELEAENRVVGIDAFSTYLDGAEDVPIVSGGIGRVDYEAALNQSPDLVIIAGNSYDSSVAEQFRRGNVTTFLMPDARSIEGVYDKTHTFGRLLGECGTAHDVVADMRDRVQTVRTAVEGESPKSVFVDLGAVRDAAERFSAGPDSFIGSIISTAGGANIVAAGNFDSPFPQVSNEFILTENPEFIVATYTPGSSFGPSTAEQARAAVRNTSVFAETAAVAEDNIIAVNGNHLNQPAPRIVDALVTLVKAFHPEAFSAANRTTTTTTATATISTTTETDTVTETTQEDTDTPTVTTTGDGGPGFGLVGAIMAVITVLVLLLRRP